MSQRLCDVSEVPPGSMRVVTASDGTSVLLCNVDGTIHAVENTCSHGASALSDGQLIGCEIECALHKGRFDLTTGKATRRPAKRPIATFECSVDDGVVYLEGAAAALRATPYTEPPCSRLNA